MLVLGNAGLELYMPLSSLTTNGWLPMGLEFRMNNEDSALRAVFIALYPIPFSNRLVKKSRHKFISGDTGSFPREMQY